MPTLTELMIIYVLKCPLSFEVRYVGITSVGVGCRFNNHIHYARKGSKYHVHLWIKTLLDQDLLPIIEAIETTSDELREVFWIKHYRDVGARLTNHTDGGGGSRGYVWSEESRERASRIQSNRSEEWRQNMSRAKQSTRHSEETKDKMRQSHLGKPHKRRGTSRKGMTSKRFQHKTEEQTQLLSIVLGGE